MNWKTSWKTWVLKWSRKSLPKHLMSPVMEPTATVLAQAVVNEGNRNLAAGANPMDLKRGIDKAVAAATSRLHEI